MLKEIFKTYHSQVAQDVRDYNHPVRWSTARQRSLDQAFLPALFAYLLTASLSRNGWNLKVYYVSLFVLALIWLIVFYFMDGQWMVTAG